MALPIMLPATPCLCAQAAVRLPDRVPLPALGLGSGRRTGPRGTGMGHQPRTHRGATRRAQHQKRGGGHGREAEPVGRGLRVALLPPARGQGAHRGEEARAGGIGGSAAYYWAKGLMMCVVVGGAVRRGPVAVRALPPLDLLREVRRSDGQHMTTACVTACMQPRARSAVQF